jgi:hypothetical protein
VDEIVTRAMLKWPNVPDVYNWLRLDERGRWRVRARDYEKSGRFETIGNRAVVEFIGRNYQPDDTGRWFFQNGPQRVFVGLACAPWVFRFDGTNLPVTHTSRTAARVEAVLLDEGQTPIFASDLGPGALSDQDFHAFIAALRDSTDQPLTDTALEAWLAGGDNPLIGCMVDGRRHPVTRTTRAELVARYGFNPDPQPPAGAADCE